MALAGGTCTQGYHGLIASGLPYLPFMARAEVSSTCSIFINCFPREWLRRYAQEKTTCLLSKARRLASLSSGTAINVTQGHDLAPLSKGISTLLLSGISTSPAFKFPGAQTRETTLQDQRLDQALKTDDHDHFSIEQPWPCMLTFFGDTPYNPGAMTVGPHPKAPSHLAYHGWKGVDPCISKSR
jgi:hypothetical protein